MRVTRLCRPDGNARTASPRRTVPLAIVPAKPRKSWFGRFTHCTGSRNGLCLQVVLDLDRLEVAPSASGPSYHGVRALRSSMLSPRSADSGTATMSVSPICCANSR